MKNLLKRLKSTRGEGYVDITVAVLIIMILLAGVIKIAPVFITKMTLNSYANELCREAEIGTETALQRMDSGNESMGVWDITIMVLSAVAGVPQKCRKESEKIRGKHSRGNAVHK